MQRPQRAPHTAHADTARAAPPAWCELLWRSRLQLHRPRADQLEALTDQRQRLNELGWYQPAAAEYAIRGGTGSYYGWLGPQAAGLPGALRRDLVVEVRVGTGSDARLWLALVGADLVDLTPAPGAPPLAIDDLSTSTLTQACAAFLEVAKREVGGRRPGGQP